MFRNESLHPAQQLARRQFLTHGSLGLGAAALAMLGGGVITEQGGMPFGVAGDGTRVGVEQQFVVVEAVAFVGAVGAVGAVAVALAGADAGQVAVPDMAGAFGQVDQQMFVACVIEQAQRHAGGMTREDGEIHAVFGWGRPEWIGSPCADWNVAKVHVWPDISR